MLRASWERPHPLPFLHLHHQMQMCWPLRQSRFRSCHPCGPPTGMFPHTSENIVMSQMCTVMIYARTLVSAQICAQLFWLCSRLALHQLHPVAPASAGLTCCFFFAALFPLHGNPDRSLREQPYILPPGAISSIHHRHLNPTYNMKCQPEWLTLRLSSSPSLSCSATAALVPSSMTSMPLLRARRAHRLLLRCFRVSLSLARASSASSAASLMNSSSPASPALVACRSQRSASEQA